LSAHAASAAAASADEINRASPVCKPHGLVVFPPSGSLIPTNARLILEGVGVEARRVQSLAGHMATLVAGKHEVPVQVSSGWKSSAGRSAVVIKPTEQLKPNQTYALKLGAKLSGAHFLDGGDNVSFTTGASKDSEKPEWISPPTVSEGFSRSWEKDQFTRFVRFSLKLREMSPAYVVLKLQRVTGNALAQTYFVPVQEDAIVAGQDPCSGRFALDEGRAYKATFEVFDMAGNAGPKLKMMEIMAPKAVVER
jgi:hypothetical protein